MTLKGLAGFGVRAGVLVLLLMGVSAGWRYGKRRYVQHECTTALADGLRRSGVVSVVHCDLGNAPRGFDTCVVAETDADGRHSSKQVRLDCEALVAGFDPQIQAAGGQRD